MNKSKSIVMISNKSTCSNTYPSIIDVSIILPIFNGEKWIDNCLNSILKQTALENNVKLETSLYNDSSTDQTDVLLKSWKTKLEKSGILFTLNTNLSGQPKGVGYAKNAAIKASIGQFLCFQDIDDVMLPQRIYQQYLTSKTKLNAIIGSKFIREPPNSTERFTNWANNLTQDELNTQIYTSHGPTVVMPTWFFHRDVFQKVGGFSEENKGTPEDLIFFYDHLDRGGSICRVDEILLIYAYHVGSATFSISSEIIWNIRFQQFIKNFMPLCERGFIIWNAGKQGRKFLKSLDEQQRQLVTAMCDVDPNKIGKFYELYCPAKRKVMNKIPIIHFKSAMPPFVICMKLDLTEGEFEKNLQHLNLQEGKDFILFS